MTRYVVAFGDPFDGITLTGPFKTFEAAQDYAEVHGLDYESWTVVAVSAPIEEASQWSSRPTTVAVVYIRCPICGSERTLGQPCRNDHFTV